METYDSIEEGYEIFQKGMHVGYWIGVVCGGSIAAFCTWYFFIK